MSRWLSAPLAAGSFVGSLALLIDEFVDVVVPVEVLWLTTGEALDLEGSLYT